MSKAKNESILAITAYQRFFENLKEHIRSAQVKAGFAVNRELIMLYWQIGRDILLRQKQEGWGAKVIDQLAKDLHKAFPEMKGFSARNLKYMRAFAQVYPKKEFVQASPAQISWYHNCTLLDKIKNDPERKWYIDQTVKNGWSRDTLFLQIESNAYYRYGKSII